MGSSSSLRRRLRRLRSFDRQQWSVIAMSAAAMPVVRLSLRRRGVMPTARLLAACSDRPIRDAGTIDVSRISEAVVVVANRRVVGGGCLPRSLVMWTFLRRRGVDAELVIGADVGTNQSLDAHAWVEVGGIPLAEPRDVRYLYGSFGLELPRLHQGQ